MTGYEIVRRTVEFDRPERLGLRFASLARPDGMDEWGCRWEKTAHAPGTDMGQVLTAPLTDWAQLDSYPFPDPYAVGRFAGLEAALDEAGGRYVQLNSPFCMFERMHFLRGMDTLLMDLLLNPQPVERLADITVGYQIGIIEQAAAMGKGRTHYFDTTDDWGMQSGMLIRPALWRKVFCPRYERLVAAAHAGGMHVRFHTDGKVNDILEDLVAIGVDIISIHQPRLLGIKEVGAQFGGRVCFEASVDIQETLPKGDRAAIEDEVQLLVEHWATPEGGLIGVEYRNLDAIGASREALQWELEAFLKYGARPSA